MESLNTATIPGPKALARLSLVALLLVGCGEADRAPEQKSRPVAHSPSLSLSPDFGDSNPHAWTGRSPTSYPVHGIDVSRWQGELDWPTAKSAGVTFAYIKATEGGDLIDPGFDEAWRNSRRAGVRRGAYHFFYHCRPAAEQAAWFIENVPRERGALPHALDMEWNPRSPTCRRKPDGAFIRAEARVFLDMLEAHYGRRPIVYTTPKYFRETGIGRLERTEFWLRSVAGHPSDTYPGAGWTFWQYSGTGRVPGVSGDVDLNVYRYSPQAWARWARG